MSCLQADFLRRAGLPYEPLPRDDINPAAHPEGSTAATEAEELLRALATVAQSRGELQVSTAISRGEMDFFLVRLRRSADWNVSKASLPHYRGRIWDPRSCLLPLYRIKATPRWSRSSRH